MKFHLEYLLQYYKRECSSSVSVPSVNVIPALHKRLWDQLLTVAGVPQDGLAERKVK